MNDPRTIDVSTNTAVVTGLSRHTKYYFRVAVLAADGTAQLSPYTPKPYPNARTGK
jgi:hypothetical protein